jgi:UDP-N-acetylmuramate--alanine ligase
VPDIHRRYMTYGFSGSSDIRAVDIEKKFMGTSFDVIYGNAPVGRFSIPIPGMHNVLNALACIGVALEVKMGDRAIREALDSFGGIQRRFEFKGESKGIKVYDDYGHHPTEIKATIAAAKENMKYLGERSRLFVVFQPHRYTRTADLMDEFGASFDGADTLVLLDIYPAGEKPIEGVTSRSLLERLTKGGRAEVVVHPAGKNEALQYVLSHMRSGDLLLTLGAGDVWKLGEKVLEDLNAS